MYDDDLGIGDSVFEPEVDEEEYEEASAEGREGRSTVEEDEYIVDIDDDENTVEEVEDEAFDEPFRLDEIEEELEEAEREHRRIMQRSIESMEDLRSESREFMGQQRDLLEDQVESFEDLRSMHEDFIQGHLESFRGLKRRYNQLRNRAESLEDVKDDYRDLMSDHIYTLEEFAQDKARDAAYKFATGLTLAGLGLAAAEFYDDDFGIPGFYANAPEIYGDSPGMALLTLGLPAAGALYLAKSYDSFEDYQDLKEDAREMKAERRQLDD